MTRSTAAATAERVNGGHLSGPALPSKAARFKTGSAAADLTTDPSTNDE